MIIGRVVVISLARRPDRLAAFRARWTAATGGLPIEVMPAVDRPDKPALGCYESHLIALTAAGPGPLLVLEDDAVFSPAFRLALPDPPPGAQLLRLGGLPGRPVPAAAAGDTPGWRPAPPIITQTHAYIAVDPPALAAGIGRRATGNVSAALAFGWPGHYWLTPPTVTQAPGESDIPT